VLGEGIDGDRSREDGSLIVLLLRLMVSPPSSFSSFPFSSSLPSLDGDPPSVDVVVLANPDQLPLLDKSGATGVPFNPTPAATPPCDDRFGLLGVDLEVAVGKDRAKLVLVGLGLAGRLVGPEEKGVKAEETKRGTAPDERARWRVGGGRGTLRAERDEEEGSGEMVMVVLVVDREGRGRKSERDFLGLGGREGQVEEAVDAREVVEEDVEGVGDSGRVFTAAAAWEA
jgi:hypothetical protein